MDKFVIHGGKPLVGTVHISGAKNAALPILFSSLLTDKISRYNNIPPLKDIDSTIAVLSHLGFNCDRCDRLRQQLTITPSQSITLTAPYDLVRTMRASILTLGPLLARYGRATVSLPGGCAIGTRPVDMHLAGLRKLGAKIRIEGGYIHATAHHLRGTTITMKKLSVTCTENLIMAASLAKGDTLLKNAACEPEIIDLIDCLNSMGAKIQWQAKRTILISGVDELSGANFRVMPDRIEIGTYIAAVAACTGKITIKNLPKSGLENIINTFKQGGVQFTEDKNQLHVKMKGRFRATSVRTAPYPGFPTDLQAQLMAVNCTANSTSTITETIFENRFMHVDELNRMGANISCEKRIATIQGCQTLTGAPVMATDLRASASLVIAALSAQGTTEINRIYHLDRGYVHMEKKLRALGASVKRARVKS